MRRALLLSAVALGCAAPQRASQPSARAAIDEAQSFRPGASVATGASVSAPFPRSPPAEPLEQPSAPVVVRPAPQPAQPTGVPSSPLDAPARPERSVGGGVAGGADSAADLDAALNRVEARLGAAVTLLRADAATCRDVCGASTTICRAAAEICRLTGDGDREAANPRCRHARLSCADAGRQRDGACPTCPDTR